MKAFKRILCAVLSAALIFGAAAVPVSAEKAVVPLILVQGFASTPIYSTNDNGTETVYFPDPSKIASMVAELFGSMLKGFVQAGLAGNDWNKVGDAMIPTAQKYLDPIGFNADGTPKNAKVTNKTYSLPMSSYMNSEKQSIFTELGVLYGAQYGESNVYDFGYDWRDSPIDAAKALDAFIAQVKKETGSSKVNLVAISEGACVALSYMSAYDCTNLNNVVFASPAWQGTSIAGSLFTGDIKVNGVAFKNFFKDLNLPTVSGDSALSSLKAVSSTLNTLDFSAMSDTMLTKLGTAVQSALPRIYDEIIRSDFAGMAGIWSLVPTSYYKNAKKYMFPDGMNKKLAAKTDAYYKVQCGAKAIVANAEKKGVKFAIVCGYNRQMAPLNANYPNSDIVIDTKFLSGGAKCAEYGGSLGYSYRQAVADGHKHVSWDWMIDASTAMFPDQVWFIKNMTHVGEFTAASGVAPLELWLLSMQEQATVQTDPQYPQFNVLDAKTKTLVTIPLTDGEMLGDMDNNGVINTNDARIVLAIASGLQKADQKQIFQGDISGDKALTTVDARDVLCMAVGVAY